MIGAYSRPLFPFEKLFCAARFHRAIKRLSCAVVRHFGPACPRRPTYAVADRIDLRLSFPGEPADMVGRRRTPALWANVALHLVSGRRRHRAGRCVSRTLTAQSFSRIDGMRDGPGSTRERLTTEAARRATQNRRGTLRQARIRALAKRYGINQKTVARWNSSSGAAPICSSAATCSPKAPIRITFRPARRKRSNGRTASGAFSARTQSRSTEACGRPDTSST